MAFEFDLLTKEILCRAIGDADLSVHVHRSLDSTNSEAKRLALSGGGCPALIVAESQSAGRGRMGRSFYSPADTGVYFSILDRAKGSLADAVTLTGAAAVAVMRAIRSLCGKQTQIKWVNDLYLEGRKVCGILAESVTLAGEAPYVILGIGINLRTSDFPPELAGKAGSLGACELSRAALIAQVWREIQPFLRDPHSREWLEEYRAHSCVLGKPIRWVDGGNSFSGIAEGIDEDGRLAVRTDLADLVLLRTGEISIFTDLT